MKVTINNKKYDVPVLEFKHFTKMEDQGFSIIEAFQKKQYMLMAMGFVCAVTGLDREDAEYLIEQHVLGGGKLTDIVNDFNKAIRESDFFKKTLGLDKIEDQKAETEEETENTEEK